VGTKQAPPAHQTNRKKKLKTRSKHQQKAKNQKQKNSRNSTQGRLQLHENPSSNTQHQPMPNLQHYRSKQDLGIMPTSFLSFHVSSSHILTDASLNLTIQFKMLGIVFISSLIHFKIKATRMPYKSKTKQFDNYHH
jgi:hypothetical protein